MNSQRIRLWDLPIRLFHWGLVLVVVAAVVSGLVGGNLIDMHGKLGLAIVGLIAFRVVWGFAGSTYARFAQFFPTPAKVRLYLKGEWRGLGHNPLGGLSVFVLLSLLMMQVASGLFANDDIAFTGPLYELVSKAMSDRLTGIHHLLSDVLIAFVVLHVGAVAFHGHFKKDNLVKPMLTGWKEGASGEPAKGGGVIALLVALVVAAAAIFGASGTWLPEPAPPPAAETPSW